MSIPKFNNTPNEHFRFNYHSNHGNVGLDYWISRSVAVVGIVFAITKNGFLILITKRSDKMMDEAGKYGLMCGYIDWGESLYEAMIREVYEETSLYLPDFSKNIAFDNNKKSFDYHDDPKNNRQNISHLFLTVLDFTDNSEFPIDITKFKDKETAEVIWMSLNDFYNVYDKGYDWAFNHNDTIKEAIRFFNKNFINLPKI